MADPRCLYGIHAVSEWLRARPRHIRLVQYDAHAAARTAAVVRLATTAGVPVLACSERKLSELAGTPRHQGVVAQAGPFPYADIGTVLAPPARLLVVVDQLQDPHNLGALLRTAEAVGAGGVILPKDSSVGVTPTVEAVAAGAAALVPVCRVTNIARTLQRLKEQACWTVGLVPHDGENLFTFAAPEPLAVVLGGESGMRPLVARQCDFTVSIPMFGRVESLNASVAAAVALYELRRQLAGRALASSSGSGSGEGSTSGPRVP